LSVVVVDFRESLSVVVVVDFRESLSVVVVDFRESLSVVSEAVKQAEFLAIDAEFSGFVCVIVVC